MKKIRIPTCGSLSLLDLLLLSEGPLDLAEANQRKKKCPETEQTHPRLIGHISGVIDLGSRVGKEQKIAMEIGINMNLSHRLSHYVAYCGCLQLC